MKERGEYVIEWVVDSPINLKAWGEWNSFREAPRYKLPFTHDHDVTVFLFYFPYAKCWNGGYTPLSISSGSGSDLEVWEAPESFKKGKGVWKIENGYHEAHLHQN